ncbi:MAG TPA: hypothetical protein VFG50_11460 [Rhodothermales bacterium]|nr:hypothetical protein [Rhodothermales bacterium]
MLRFIFLLVILYFIFVAVRNLVRAVQADSRAARIDQQREKYYYRPQQRAYQQPSPQASQAPPKTTIHIRPEPPSRSSNVREEDIEDAKFKDI